jgi:hypothetical protein
VPLLSASAGFGRRPSSPLSLLPAAAQGIQATGAQFIFTTSKCRKSTMDGEELHETMEDMQAMLHLLPWKGVASRVVCRG